MHIPMEMPDLGMGVISARISVWHKGEGDSIEFGDVICEVTAHERSHRNRDRDASTMMAAQSGAHRARSIIKRIVRAIRRRVRRRRFQKRLTSGDGARRAGWSFRIIASESCTMGKATAAVGSIVTIGAVMATVELPFIGESGEATPAKLRLATELIDRAGESIQ